MPTWSESDRFRQALSAALPQSVKMPAPFGHALGKLLLLDWLFAVYERLNEQNSERCLFDRALEELKVQISAGPADLERIPRSGPALLVANHPFGFVEGIVLASVLPKIRPDVKFLVNSFLSTFTKLPDLFIYVNPFGGHEANRRNRGGLKRALTHLKNGGALVVFPAGAVAHLDIRERAVVDPPWNPAVARLARLGDAAVVPMYFSGANSPLFQLLGFVHPRARTAMLPHELMRKQDSTIELRVGTAIAPEKLRRMASDEDAIAHLRHRTYLLRHRELRKNVFRWPVALNRAVVPPVSSVSLEREIQALPHARLLAQQGEMHVYYGRAHEIPSIVREIGRIREETFRRAGEGTGKSTDIDAFDAHYIQLFIWNAHSKEIIGAYRMGPTDEIRSKYGLRGFYTRTLFRYDVRLLDALGDGLELGRSFVRAEYQKNYAPLLLLWKGIAAYVYRNPHYRVLFGAVSISDSYQPVSRQLLVSYFQEQEIPRNLRSLVEARSPFRTNLCQPKQDLRIGDIEELSALIADIELDGKGVPVLLRQYLKLGGRLLAFSVDRQFANALDGLVVVDLRQTERRVLERYMGRTEAAVFLAYQSPATAQSA